MTVDFHQGFTNNKAMDLPIYKHINIKTDSLEELGNVLKMNMNHKNAVSINLKALKYDQQQDSIELIENFFVSQNLSYLFPYPIYVISDIERSMSKIPLVSDIKELPKFFNQKESKMNVKEAHLVAKNKLLQQEIQNTDPSHSNTMIQEYGGLHRAIYKLERERKFYGSLLNSLIKIGQNG